MTNVNGKAYLMCLILSSTTHHDHSEGQGIPDEFDPFLNHPP
jgi:hypothetical protein